ncbi:hypothetical protein ACWN8V_00670 [Vagococcus elongatus]|uniref:Uncharacterized protein n=1 Tax=Vagococcus elongatus TaxID=180344 RepID=A0A430B5P1_9ENTE|nr:hypothetical protein [Vagococcus elongatus]RSU15618.1 hypothetical protein CBF29_00655 [Vagococcus elongatus]
MKEHEYLMIVAMEECAEIQQALSKSLRFGLDDTHPETPELSNEKQVLLEFYQLCAVMERLQKERVLQTPSEMQIDDIKTRKMEKVAHFMKYSKSKKII